MCKSSHRSLEPSKEVPAPINKKIYQNLIYFNLFKAYFEPIFSHKRHKTAYEWRWHHHCGTDGNPTAYHTVLIIHGWDH